MCAKCQGVSVCQMSGCECVKCQSGCVCVKYQGVSVSNVSQGVCVKC